MGLGTPTLTILNERSDSSPIDSSTVSTTAIDARYQDKVVRRLWDWTITWSKEKQDNLALLYVSEM